MSFKNKLSILQNVNTIICRSFSRLDPGRIRSDGQSNPWRNGSVRKSVIKRTEEKFLSSSVTSKSLPSMTSLFALPGAPTKLMNKVCCCCRKMHLYYYFVMSCIKETTSLLFWKTKFCTNNTTNISPNILTSTIVYILLL